MNLDGGNFEKFTVIKNEDIYKYLDTPQQGKLWNLLDKIIMGRCRENKNINTYLVINTDEPYAPEIVEILKRNGHWG